MNSTFVADVFRTEWPRLVATLVRDVGDLGVAEDAAQDAFVEAAVRWERDGTPDRPGAWLLTTARRKAIDRIRRTNHLHTLLPLLSTDAANRHRNGPDASDPDALDDQLALLLGCCHPALAPEAQIALTLRVVAGLSTAQIARAFLVSEPTMTRRLTRSKTKIRSARIPFVPPTVAVLEERLPAVCGVIYSIFTEGHASATSASLVRGDLCDEAIWLAELLGTLVPDEPEIDGLVAMLLLTDARRSTRVAHDGTPILLADQDRSQWDRHAIGRGLARLAKAHSRGSGGMFQFQAAIAALHATAPSFDQTDWSTIVAMYDAMLRRQPTALIALNRAIAVAHVDGPEVALSHIDAIARADDLTGSLDDYPYFHSARAELLARLGRFEASRAAFDRALAVTTNDAESRHLTARQHALALD